ncbi:hypothetical protein [Comamonas sp. UBA7528]|uniref:hypothetical protein n=1 Tax=Comamonas sp. UBA7528 TaxID=1946391 RepID=UPI0025B9B8B9|nr:hypothetical protein [Comamonas sp. UBA7528]
MGHCWWNPIALGSQHGHAQALHCVGAAFGSFCGAAVAALALLGSELFQLLNGLVQQDGVLLRQHDGGLCDLVQALLRCRAVLQPGARTVNDLGFAILEWKVQAVHSKGVQQLQHKLGGVVVRCNRAAAVLAFAWVALGLDARMGRCGGHG